MTNKVNLEKEQYIEQLKEMRSLAIEHNKDITHIDIIIEAEERISNLKSEISFCRRVIRKAKRILTPKTNMDFIRKILGEATRSLSIEEAAKLFLELHPLNSKDPEKRAKYMFIKSEKFGVLSEIEEVGGIKYIKLRSKKFDSVDILGATDEQKQIIKKRLEQTENISIEKIIVDSEKNIDIKRGGEPLQPGYTLCGYAGHDYIYMNCKRSNTEFDNTLCHEIGHLYHHQNVEIEKDISYVSKTTHVPKSEAWEIYADKFRDHLLKDTKITDEILTKIFSSFKRAMNKLFKQNTQKKVEIFQSIMTNSKKTVEEINEGVKEFYSISVEEFTKLCLIWKETSYKRTALIIVDQNRSLVLNR